MIMVAPDRVLHVCRLGSRLDFREIGAHVVYVGVEGEVTVSWTDRPQERSRVVVVPAYGKHRIAADRQVVKTILIEPETVSDRCLADLSARLACPKGADPLVERLLGHGAVPDEMPGGAFPVISRDGFDLAVFGGALEGRQLDERIEYAMAFIRRRLGDTVLTADCAQEFSLSSSRFRRLFADNTGIPFRRYRMWKRARAYLEQVFEPASLTEIALELGYPDSAHFSRSIRATYGLTPRDMRAKMRGAVYIHCPPSPDGAIGRRDLAEVSPAEKDGAVSGQQLNLTGARAFAAPAAHV